jgi:hypothetical protein
MIYYLKNTSGETVVLDDLGIILQNGDHIEIDSNDVSGWLTTSLYTALTTQSELILSTTSENNYGDMEPADAIKALTLVSMGSTGNPMGVTFTQVAQADQITDITAYEAEELTNGSDTELHIHDNRYYTKEELTTPEKAVVNWKNLIDIPALGSPDWQAPIQHKIEYISRFEPTNGEYYINIDDKGLYRYVDDRWTFVSVTNGFRVLDVDTNEIAEFHGGEWTIITPKTNWTVLVNDDGDGKAAQYIFNGTKWIKIADADWGDHNALSGRENPEAHPATAISWDSRGTLFTGTNLQQVLVEINKSVAASKIITSPKEIHVAMEGDDTNGTGSIAFPYKTLKKAFTIAFPIAPVTIILHSGTYEEKQTLAIIDGVTLQGFIPNTVIVDCNVDFSGTNNAFDIKFIKPVNISGTHDIKDCIFDDVVFNNYNGTLQNVTAATMTVNDSDVTLSDCIITSVQHNSGTVNALSGFIESYISEEETVINWGLTQVGSYDFKGIFKPINLAKYIQYDNSISGLGADTVQDAITETKLDVNDTQADLDAHKNDTTNSHQVSLVQTIEQDPITDITPEELETLSNGSMADILHRHSALNTVYDPIELIQVDVQNAIDYIAKNYLVYPQNVIYVAKNGSNEPLPKMKRGSASAPYLTIGAALNRIDQNSDNTKEYPYIIWVGPGVYHERILLNDDNFKHIIFLGNGSIIDPPEKDGEKLESVLTSMRYNENLEQVEFHDFIFKTIVNAAGETNNTNLFKNKLLFKNCSLGHIIFNNVNNIEFENCQYTSMSVANTASITFRNCKQTGTLISIYTAFEVKPPLLENNNLYFYDSDINGIDAYDHTIIHMYHGSLATGRIYGTINTYCTQYNIQSVQLKEAGKWVNKDISYRNQYFNTYGVYATLDKIASEVDYIYNIANDYYNKIDINGIINNLRDAIYTNFYTKEQTDEILVTNYYNKTEIDTINANYYNKAETIENYYDKLDIDEKIYAINVVLGIVQAPEEEDDDGSVMNAFMENFRKSIFNDLYETLNNMTVDFSDYYTKLDVNGLFQTAFDDYFNKIQVLELVSNVNAKINSYYDMTAVDALFKNIYDTYYTRDYVDAKVAELNAIYNNYYNIPVMDHKILEIYNTITSGISTAVSEIHQFFDATCYTKTAIDMKLADIVTMFNSYYNKSEILNLFYTKTQLDISIEEIVLRTTYTKRQVDNLFTHYYNKTEVDELLTAIQSYIAQLESNIYTKTEINMKLEIANSRITTLANDVYTKVETNAITDGIIDKFKDYYPKNVIDVRFSQLINPENYFTKVEVGEKIVEIKSMFDDYYTKFEVDTIISSLQIPSTYETKIDAIEKYNNLNDKITNTNTTLNQTNSLVDAINARLKLLENDNVIDGGYSDLELEEWDGGDSSG